MHPIPEYRFGIPKRQGYENPVVHFQIKPGLIFESFEQTTNPIKPSLLVRDGYSKEDQRYNLRQVRKIYLNYIIADVI